MNISGIYIDLTPDEEATLVATIASLLNTESFIASVLIQAGTDANVNSLTTTWLNSLQAGSFVLPNPNFDPTYREENHLEKNLTDAQL